VQFSLWRLLAVVTAIAIVLGILRFLPASVVATTTLIAACIGGAGVFFWIDGLVMASKSTVMYAVMVMLAMATYICVVLAAATILWMVAAGGVR